MAFGIVEACAGDPEELRQRVQGVAYLVGAYDQQSLVGDFRKSGRCVVLPTLQVRIEREKAVFLE